MSIDDLRLLRYFVATAEAGSANRAATILHVGQPSLSRQLRQFERSLGLQLFERRGRGLALTSAGRELVAVAQHLLQAANYADHAVDDLAQGRVTRLRMAVPTTTLTDVVAPFLATLRSDDPMPSLTELDPTGAEAALQGGADFAIVTRPPDRPLRSMLLARLPIWAQVPPGHGLADRSSVTMAELTAETLFMVTPQFRPRKVFDAAASAAQLRFTAINEFTNAQVAQALAAAGRGVAVVSDDPRFGLAPLRIADHRAETLTIDLYATWAEAHHAGAVIDDLVRRLRAFCAQRYPDAAAR